MVSDLLTVYLCTVRVVSLEGLANNRVERFQKHGYVVKS